MGLVVLADGFSGVQVTIQVAIKKAEAQQRIVYSEVYVPMVPDSDGEYMNDVEIRKMAHGFMRNKRMDQVDHAHTNEIVPGAYVVESFVARKDDKDFIPGAWVIGVHIPRDEDWDRVEKQQWNSFSIEAVVLKRKKEVELEVPPVLSGVTMKAEDGHSHQFYVAYDERGRFLGGRTDASNEHFHVIKRGTLTEDMQGHSHRFSHVEGLSLKEIANVR